MPRVDLFNNSPSEILEIMKSETEPFDMIMNIAAHAPALLRTLADDIESGKTQVVAAEIHCSVEAYPAILYQLRVIES